jgi:hypothetical protein
MPAWNDPNWNWSDSTPWNAPLTPQTTVVQALQASGAASVTGAPALGARRALVAAFTATVTPGAALGAQAPSNLPNASTFTIFVPTTPQMGFRLSSLYASGYLMASGAAYVTGSAGLGGLRRLKVAEVLSIASSAPLGALRALRASGLSHAAGTGNLGYYISSASLQAHGQGTASATALLGARRALQSKSTLNPVTATMAFTGTGTTTAVMSSTGLNSLTFNPG